MGLSQLLVRPPLDQLVLFALFLAAVWLIELGLQLGASMLDSNPPWMLVAILGISLTALSIKRTRRFLWVQGEFVYRSYLTLNRDLTGLALLIRIRLDMRKRMRENRGLHELFLDNVRAHPNKICIFDMACQRSYTFAEFNALANRFANHFRNRGYQCGDVCALFMENGVEFVAAWVGLAKIGVVTAWINSNLRMESLAHCLRVSECKGVICSENLWPTLQATKAAGHLAGLESMQEFALGPESRADSLAAIFAAAAEGNKLSEEPTPEPRVTFRSLLCFIYTSGTTGMPKPACIKHFRYYSMATGCADSFGLRPTDRLYIPMPLYHTAAGIIGIGQVLLRGSSCAIRARFSASNFWRDCLDYECTASQYIGEICRYLLAQPACEAEKRHKVRLMFGNGLRAEIWKEFVDRFGVQIGEVYGSTEGTSNLVNIDGKIGACGFLPISPITSLVHPVRLVKVDENGEIVRKPDGLAVPCRPGQTGAMVSTIRHDNPLLVFDGYLNQAETKKKVIQNVFRPGDSAFLTGDILHWDRLGYLYFRIRTGDTFRFKGENVSTAEVVSHWRASDQSINEEAVLLPLKCIIDAVVYGICVPGLEGSVGMAALVKNREAGSDEDFLRQLSDRLRTSLPPFAIPRFVRICSAVDRTGTFKLVKTNLRRLALSRPAATAAEERLFIFDPATKEYAPLAEELRQRLEQGQLEEKELGRVFA